MTIFLIQDFQNKRRGSLTQKAILVLCIALIAFSIYRFLTKGAIPSIKETGYDYYHQYAAGQLWNEGLDPYDYSLFRARLFDVGQERATLFEMGYLYPPHVLFIVSGLSYMPFDMAYIVQLALSVLAIIAMLALLGIAISWFRPVGWVELTLLVALANTVASRDALRASQVSPLIFLLIVAAFVLGRYKRDVAAGFALFLAASKPTFVPLYILYYLIRRRWRLVVAFIVSSAFFTIVPLALTQRPILGYMSEWFSMLGTANGGVNDPSPFSPYSAWLTNLQALIYRVLNSDSMPVTLLSWAVIVSMCGLAFYWMYRTRQSTSDKTYILDFALVSSLSLAMIYHRQYDTFLMFPGIIYFYLHLTRQSSTTAKSTWSLLLLGILVLLTLPGDSLIGTVDSHIQLNDNYLIRLILPFQGWANVAMLIGLFWLKWVELREPKPVVAVPSTMGVVA